MIVINEDALCILDMGAVIKLRAEVHGAWLRLLLESHRMECHDKKIEIPAFPLCLSNVSTMTC
jgi:hypothetical protein